MWISFSSQNVLNSTPGTSSSFVRGSLYGFGNPSCVVALAQLPGGKVKRFARLISSEGVSVPSEKVECTCKSIASIKVLL